MKQVKFKKVISIALLFSFIVMSFGLTGCTADPQEELKQISFAYTLTEQDVQDTLDAIAQLESYIDNGKNRKIVSAVESMEEKSDYLGHQYLSAEIAYYSDLDDDIAYQNYVQAEDARMMVREERERVLKKLYASDLSAKDKVFSGWTDRELKALQVSNEEVIALEEAQNDLLLQYLELDYPDTEMWSKAVEELYFDFVINAQALAGHYEYDNYYDYAADEIYMRQYTHAQREAFRTMVKEYIIPLEVQVDKLYIAKYDSLTEEQKTELKALRQDTCSAENEYLLGYMDSSPEELRTIMHNLFDRNAIVYTEAESAHTIAYTIYSKYYDQPAVLLGNNLQDLLTVVHELGHYAAYYHFDDPDLPYDTAEVHSQANEWLMLHYLNGKIDQDVYEAFLLDRLWYGLDTIVICTIIDDYEEELYKREKIASPKDFRTIMENVINRYEGIEKIISADRLYNYTQVVTFESPVYYLSYATSELVSMLFYTIAEEQGYEAAQNVYVDLCLKTPTGTPFFDTLMDVGLPNPFEVDTVNRITESFDILSDESNMEQAA